MATRYGRLVREPETGERLQEWETLEPNELRIPGDVAEELVEALGVDFAGSFNLFYLLRKHYWTVEGAEHEEVSEFLEAAYKRARDINDDLAERIVELGGIPPNTPPTIQARAGVHLEAENLYDVRTSLEGDLDGYAVLVVSLREHIGLAEELGDPDTAERLREHLEVLEDDAQTVEEFLEDDTLVRAEEVR